MVGYVLLIGIAVALSTAVFFYLKLYLPDEKPKCEADIKLVIDSLSCTLSSTDPRYSRIEINITNKGFFKVEGAYVKIGEPGRAFKEDLNPPNDPTSLYSLCNSNTGILNPGQTFCNTYTYNQVPATVWEVSIQPVVWIENEPVLCPEAVVNKRVACA